MGNKMYNAQVGPSTSESYFKLFFRYKTGGLECLERRFDIDSDAIECAKDYDFEDKVNRQENGFYEVWECFKNKEGEEVEDTLIYTTRFPTSYAPSNLKLEAMAMNITRNI